MNKLDPGKITDNFIDLIGKEWMLITAGNIDNFNTMTANWGTVGYLWNRPVVFVFVRPERYTYEFMENEDYFTLSFLGHEGTRVHKICGSKSGRDTDKIAMSGLIPIETKAGNVVFEQARLMMECKKLYTANLNPANFFDESIIEKWYTEKGEFHKMYVAEIFNVWESDNL